MGLNAQALYLILNDDVIRSAVAAAAIVRDLNLSITDSATSGAGDTAGQGRDSTGDRNGAALTVRKQATTPSGYLVQNLTGLAMEFALASPRDPDQPPDLRVGGMDANGDESKQQVKPMDVAPFGFGFRQGRGIGMRRIYGTERQICALRFTQFHSHLDLREGFQSPNDDDLQASPFGEDEKGIEGFRTVNTPSPRSPFLERGHPRSTLRWYVLSSHHLPLGFLCLFCLSGVCAASRPYSSTLDLLFSRPAPMEVLMVYPALAAAGSSS